MKVHTGSLNMMMNCDDGQYLPNVCLLTTTLFGGQSEDVNKLDEMSIKVRMFKYFNIWSFINKICVV